MEQWSRILSGGEPDKYTETGSFGEALCNECPADGRAARVDGLVD